MAKLLGNYPDVLVVICLHDHSPGGSTVLPTPLYATVTARLAVVTVIDIIKRSRNG